MHACSYGSETCQGYMYLRRLKFILSQFLVLSHLASGVALESERMSIGSVTASTASCSIRCELHSTHAFQHAVRRASRCDDQNAIRILSCSPFHSYNLVVGSYFSLSLNTDLLAPREEILLHSFGVFTQHHIGCVCW